MKEELYEDILKEEPDNNAPEIEHQKFHKRLEKSIGWIEPEEHHEVILEKSKKDNQFGGVKLASSSLDSEIHWDVNTGDGSGFTCKSQIHAHMLSLLVQINERLKRVEKEVKPKNDEPIDDNINIGSTVFFKKRKKK